MKQTAQSVDPQFAAGVQGSDLYNDDLAPTGPAQRTWRWYHFAALWVGMVMNIASYMLAANCGSTDCAVCFIERSPHDR
jgi:NCS1 family nucleobase:cation symporter-1